MEDKGPANRSTHWVEELLKPHFSLKDAMETFEELRKKTRISERDPSLPECLQSAEGREIYERALLENQRKEERLLREKLAKRLAAENASAEAASATVSQSSSTVQCQSKQSEESAQVQIWNKEDVSVLCETVRKLERDGHRLSAQLQQAQTEVQAERQERQRLRHQLDEREQQLAVSRQEAARWALQLEAQQAEAQAKDARVRALAAENRQMAEEVARWRTAAKIGRQESKEAQQKCSDLTWELERVREQHRVEERRLAEAARLEEGVIVQRLRLKLQEAKAELEAEKSNHARSQSALELLRKHFTSQSG